MRDLTVTGVQTCALPILAGRNWLVLRVEFRLTAGDRKSLAKKSREIIRLRAKKYPPGLRCPGSFFKNVLVKDLSRITLDKIDRSKIIAGKVPAGYLLPAARARRPPPRAPF